MSKNKESNAAEFPVKETVKPLAVESVYTAEELAKNHKVFNTYREIVVVALKRAGKQTATFSEAKKIIDEFKNREVK